MWEGVVCLGLRGGQKVVYPMISRLYRVAQGEDPANRSTKKDLPPTRGSIW